jgi:hypothetical protein
MSFLLNGHISPTTASIYMQKQKNASLSLRLSFKARHSGVVYIQLNRLAKMGEMNSGKQNRCQTENKRTLAFPYPPQIHSKTHLALQKITRKQINAHRILKGFLMFD